MMNTTVACWLRGVLLFGALALGASAWGETPGRGDKGPVHGVPETEPEAQEELQVPPPRYPRDADLAQFTLRNPTPNHFYIDTSSISVAKDQIIRFVMVIRTPGNETNVRFSGLHCATHEWKDYAFAGDDKKWVINDKAQWRRIVELHYNNYQDTLFGDYFCLSGVLSTKPVGDAQKLAKLLRDPQRPDPRIPFRKESAR